MSRYHIIDSNKVFLRGIHKNFMNSHKTLLHKPHESMPFESGVDDLYLLVRYFFTVKNKKFL